MELTFSSAELTFDSAELTFGSAELTIGSAELTFSSAELTLGSAELTFSSAELTLGSAELTFGSAELTFSSAELTFSSAELTLGSADVTFGSKDIDGQVHGRGRSVPATWTFSSSDMAVQFRGTDVRVGDVALRPADVTFPLPNPFGYGEKSAGISVLRLLCLTFRLSCLSLILGPPLEQTRIFRAGTECAHAANGGSRGFVPIGACGGPSSHHGD